ncbi:hypothetical protein ACIOG8_07945 [Streptomyces erythrochromogenes]|uniref:hypothetical protein n=1 Tax=Streptomyces erythrochromogenes TaxID=285574 RepID=UPI00382B6815
MRRSRVLGAAALALAIGLGGLTAVPAAAGPTAADDLTIPSPPHQDPAPKPVHAAGAGLTMGRGWNGERYWQSLQDGREATVVPCPSHSDEVVFHGDSMACGVGPESAVSPDNTGPLTIRDLGSGTSETLTAPPGRAWMRAFSPTQALAAEVDQVGWLTLHLIGRGDEPRKDVVVTSPERFGTYAFRVRAFDRNGALVTYLKGSGGDSVALLDFATATLRPVPMADGVTSTDHTKFGLGSQWIAMENSGKVTLRSRSDGKETRTVDLADWSAKAVQPLGDWLLAQTGGGLSAVPVTGGAARKLLHWTAEKITVGADGAAYVVGGTDSTHWGVHRIAPGPGSAPVVEKVVDVPPNPAKREGLAFAQGQLAVGQSDPAWSVQGYTASVSGPPTVSQTPAWKCDLSVNAKVCGVQDAAGHRSVATGDGRFVSLLRADVGDCFGCHLAVNVIDAAAGGTVRQVLLEGGREMWPGVIQSVSGRYIMFTAAAKSTSRSYVADIETGKVLDVVPDWSSELWGSTLWQAEGSKGVVAGTDLRTGRITQRVDLGSGCRPHRIMAAGSWLYAACSSTGDGAAAFHVPSEKRVPLPFRTGQDYVRLGDGYLVRQEGVGLEVYNLRSGTAVREREISQWFRFYGVDWGIDRFGGRLAYTDAGQTVHLVGVTGNASPLAVIDQDVAATADFRQVKTWQARWWLSKPVSSWKLTVRNTSSGITTVVRTGTDARGLIAPAWDGKSPTGTYLFSGEYEWTLTARPADGRGAEVSTSGTVSMTRPPTGGRPPARP